MEWSEGIKERDDLISKDDRLNLMHMNDYGGFSFDEIADCLQALYVLKVLE